MILYLVSRYFPLSEPNTHVWAHQPAVTLHSVFGFWFVDFFLMFVCVLFFVGLGFFNLFVCLFGVLDAHSLYAHPTLGKPLKTVSLCRPSEGPGLALSFLSWKAETKSNQIYSAQLPLWSKSM